MAAQDGTVICEVCGWAGITGEGGLRMHKARKHGNMKGATTGGRKKQVKKDAVEVYNPITPTVIKKSQLNPQLNGKKLTYRVLDDWIILARSDGTTWIAQQIG